MKTWRTRLATVAAVLAFAFTVYLFRRVSGLGLGIAGFTWVATFLLMTPGRPAKVEDTAPSAPPLPADAATALAELDAAATRLSAMAASAPPADVPLFEHMADLTRTLGEHHRANPDHAARTAKFRKHVLGRIVGSVENYIDLTERAGGHDPDRLAGISSQLEGFVPVLERIDRACLDNDLTALEINVEVLNEQLDRKQ